MKTVSFSSIKGGTGKSSLTILSANYLAAAGYHVLVADFDIQNSITAYYLDSPDAADRKNIATALHTENVLENIIQSNRTGIDLIASSFDLIKLRSIPEHTFERMLKNTQLPYDFLIMDTPPTYDNIVLNAVNGSDCIICPVQFTQFDFKGALFYQAQINRETDKLPLWHILFNFYRPSRSDNPDALRNQYESLFRDSFSDAILPLTIPETTSIRRAIDTGEKITESAAKVAIHDAVASLASWLGADRKAGRF